ncbi:putative 6-phosphofructo-2-kinase/fructose-2,6-biphosphatase [Trypanosoma conorhini]|uniref:Putative 6-phosphofructo-2-kinase/fructose-2,6-biphosphatase n=1 Tax=Trypanosoma conorhini TaxID=83891 RepID=A0A422NH85_9TRYP|nr:putative 6-phosphofructo-2-kinase/fructose-2,6-biphosphatase [Trypanosoma conorhini]RNF04817.1 putative 6-phosphofructo-2-kinase/fructose-2,6-biphosphatase [Trypanosoma conorhini]
MEAIELMQRQAGLDVYFPGCNWYYRQHRPRHLPYMDGSLYKPWQPYNEVLLTMERQRRRCPASIEEACIYGSLAHVIKFWAQGQELREGPVNFEGSDATLLMWCALRGNLGVARFLLDQGVKLNVSNGLGHTALHWAVAGVQYDVTSLLLDHGADPLQKDFQGYSAYFSAVQANNLPLLLMLCECHPLDAKERDLEGHSLLHWAAYTNSLAICQYLVEKCHIELDTLDNNRRTPLLWAAREGYAVVVEYLVSCGARTDVADMNNYTALQYARFRNHRETVYVLTKNHAALRNGINESVHSDSSPFNTVGRSCTEVRRNRRRGTMSMMLREPIFLVMSLFGLFYVAFSYLLLKVIPPLISHFVVALFFFRNALWTILFGFPVQGGKPELSSIQKLGIANSFGESARGIWLFRDRDAASLLALTAFVLLQQYAWAKMGLVPLITYYRPDEAALTGHTLESVYQPREKGLFGLLFHNKAELEQFVLLSLLCLMLLSGMLCKLLSMRSTHEPSESSLDASPLWAIMRRRAYRWLHPRILSMERHMLIPLRTFYCYERDVFLRRFDGYSIALDCPIAESNHRLFFIFVTSFACLQWLTFVWSWEQTSELLQCPQHSSFLGWVFGSLWSLLIHALPCRDETRRAVASYGPWLSWLRYILPTEANHLGVWLLQYSLWAAVLATWVAVRQWVAAATGATCVELANPTATSSEGGLVSIFPPTLSSAAPWFPPEGVTEGVAKPVEDTTAVPPVAKINFRCIYANHGNALLNMLDFFLGRAGRRWRGAVAVSPANAPLFTLAVLSDPGGG